MTDIFDQATEREEQERERAIAAARKPVSVVPFTGFCHNCDEPVEAHFCDRECHRDYEYRMHIRRKQGLA